MKKIVLSAFAVSFLILLTGCSPSKKLVKKLQSGLPGTWQVTEMYEDGSENQIPEGVEMLFTFSEEGKLEAIMSFGERNEQAEGTWELTKEGQVILTLNDDPFIGEAELKGDQLILDGEAEGDKIVIKMERKQ